MAPGDTTPTRVAIVTGAGRGIGRAIALRLARDGFAVGLCARSAEVDAVADELAAAGAVAFPARVDMADAGAVRAFVGQVAERLGRLDVLVNNAGINRGAALVDARLDDVDAMLAVNVRGPIAALQAAVPHLEACGDGRIVNVASWVARRPPPGFVAYAATKAALVALTTGAAAELGSVGITVNAVCPGNVWTGIWEAATGRDEADARRLYEQAVAAQPLPRHVSPEDVADTVAFLCSAAARGITGECLAVAGGL